MRRKEKLVIFDWGGIIESHRDGEYNFESARIDFARKITNKTFSNQEILTKWSRCSKDENGKMISEIKDGEEIEKWFTRLKKEYEFDCSITHFYKTYQKVFRSIDYYKDVVSYIHQLKSRCSIAILSNLCFYDYHRINKQAKLRKFDYVFLSYELNCRKPDEAIYQLVEEKSGFSPENILFIDDTEKNLEIPKKRGWKVGHAYGYELQKIIRIVENFLNEEKE